MPQPIIIIDEAGDIDYPAFLLIKELWNATEDVCGWYMMGANGLRKTIERGVSNCKVGYAEILSRFNGKYSGIVPCERTEKMKFYKKLLNDFLTANCDNKEIINAIVKKCLIGENGNISGLRRADYLLTAYEDKQGL